ncbi:class I SAM-dependent methyltransferase [Nocardioides sp.]|uniref:class I SAM-dependent methyltransferase n=1 Tax=Nocardioides sp. TaxID=35761 RepID=UPI002615C402|nr:class I SAM-dependent methyltransferase [Nocardioides sp.]MDI6910722.1 class I SAM-dependent methyltransferase [Nocardioides sp.]
MSAARLRLAALAVALLLVAVPVVFGLVDGRTGVLVGLALSGAVAATGVCAYVVLRRVEERLRVLERRVARAQRPRQQAVAAQPKLPKGLVTQAQLRKERDHVAKRVQDITNLFDMVPIRAGIPPLGLWTASADLLVELVDRFVETRPATVVEGGSGVSTVVLALAAREHGIATRIVALEHDPEWAESTRRLLARHGVAEYAEVRVAPLGPTSLADHHTPWYDESALADLSEVGLVLVDGPPEGTGPRARYPMVPLLHDRLARTCTIVVDDTARPGDADVVDRWRPLLPDFEFDTLRLDKGAAVLTRA